MVKNADMFFKKKLNKESKKPKAAVFVDFEHWYISLSKLHYRKPDIKGWRDSLLSEFELDEIYFFADFSNPSLQTEVRNIRAVTNFIIETGSNQINKKDFTDFIMLDRIYQTAFSRDDIDVYIIFSGDGHFASVVRFLTSKRHKKVYVYGVRDAISQQLINSATQVREIPDPKTSAKGYYYPILNNLDYLENCQEAGKNIHPTFGATVEAVSRYYKLEAGDVKDSLVELIEGGYVRQVGVEFRDHQIKELRVNWQKAIEDGIWSKR